MKQKYLKPSHTFRYKLIYKQAVSTEDVFLGMGSKTPTTASCEDIIVSNPPPSYASTHSSYPSLTGEGAATWCGL